MTVSLTVATRPPRPLPLIGYALRFARAPLELVESLRPAGDVVRVRIGLQTVYWVNKPELVRQVLGDAGTFDKGMQAEKLRIIVGNGLVTAAGDHHVRRRRLVQPAFHRTRIAGYVRTMRELAAEAVERWRDGERIEADKHFAQLTLRVVGKTLFSTTLGNETVDEVVRSMPVVMHGLGVRIRDPFGLRGRLPTPANREFEAAVRRLWGAVDRIVAEYRAAGVDHGDMASMLLLARDEETGEGLSDEAVRDEVLTVLTAGHETTANALSWAVHHLGERPDIETRVHAEVDDVLGERGVTFEDIPNLTFLHSVVMETLRLYPPAWILTRRATTTARLGDVELPAGASVFFAPYALQRDPAVYSHPDDFDPDRWSGDRSPLTQRPSFVPFGGGRRQCLGDVFAMNELVVVLATIAQRWRLVPVAGESVRINSISALKPNHLPMTPQRRVAATTHQA
jgi:cytochrome P450